MESEALKDLVIDALDDIRGHDVIWLDVTEQTDVSDYMVIASGNSSRQVKALADSVVEKAKAAGVRPLGVEGEDQSEWILIDLTDVIVHVMLPSVREFYDLERLWTLRPGENKGAGE